MLAASLLVAALLTPPAVPAPAKDGTGHKQDYRLLATNKTSTMQKEMSEAAAAGYRFQAVMGGETGFGGAEVVVIMGREGGAAAKPAYEYQLLATSKTSTMQKELQQAADGGFEYVGQTVFSTAFRGKEVVVIMEKTLAASGPGHEYLLLATNKTSTMDQELQQAASNGYAFCGMTVGETLFGGRELVIITKKPRSR